MKPCVRNLLLPLALIGLVATAPATRAEGEDETAWNTVLKQKLFADRPIVEDRTVAITVPYRAEDPALVPLTIASQFPQTPEKYIRNITVVIDNNPVPFSASFDFFPESGKADIATRMRFNAYTHVRAIAETNDGKLHMAKAFVKASGGCSAPIGADIEAAKARMGKMKFKFDGDKVTLGQPNPVQLLVSHPNITGMQMDQISRIIQPAHYVNEVKVSFEGKPILIAKTDIAISADPNFRFYFTPDKAGELKAEIKDNLGNQYSTTQAVTP
jgi:sulfur-oxidizing protein SoxY